MKTSILLLALATAPLALPSQDDPAPWTQEELEALSAEISGQLEELRGERFVRPVEVRVASSEDLIEYMKERLAKTETPEKLAADEAVAKLLGVIPVDMNLIEATFELIESQVGGFYDPDSDSFSLMEQLPRGIAPTILAHELDHALDDQLYGIDQKLLPVAHLTDASLAFSSVVEGSGMNVMTQWQARHGDAVDVDAMMAMQEASQAGLAEAPMWMWKPLMAVYMRGSCFLTRTDSMLTGLAAAATPEDIRAAFERPPRSTEQVLHPEKYWDPEQLDEPVAVKIETDELPGGFELQRADVLGELALATVLTPGSASMGLDVSNPVAALSVPYTSVLAEGWGGDALVLLGDGEGRYLRLVTVWDSARDAGEFYGGLQAVLPGMRAAAEALSDRKSHAGVEAAYGERDDVVVLSSWHSVDSRDRRKLERALRWTLE